MIIYLNRARSQRSVEVSRIRNNKKQHQQSVGCNQDVIELTIPCLNSRSNITEFHSNLQTYGCRNHPNPSRKNKVHYTNVFGIGTTKPSNKQTIQFIISFSHWFFSFFKIWKKEAPNPKLIILKHMLYRLSYLAYRRLNSL